MCSSVCVLAHSCLLLCFFLFKLNKTSCCLVFFLQNSLDSVPTLEESSGMDLDAESVTDAKNNLNTARWAVYFTNTSCLDLPSEFSVDTKQTRGSGVAVLIRHLPSANCFDTPFQPELTFYAASLSQSLSLPTLIHLCFLLAYLYMSYDDITPPACC